ncbi:hypothetical protein SLS53_003313 [Cytospora paraplurivora]|uniref:Uncharacterized protein n=1 Tax=Cytospora paraplurivora TaxID=2898453 RepID=A0AAN9UCI5_9PEZI
MAWAHTYFTLLVLAFFPSGLFPTAKAQKPVAYTDSSQYSYQGCYRETTDIPNTNGARALDDGKSWVEPEFMTVPKCLGYCGGGSGEVYNFAGLEYSSAGAPTI